MKLKGNSHYPYSSYDCILEVKTQKSNDKVTQMSVIRPFVRTVRPQNASSISMEYGV